MSMSALAATCSMVTYHSSCIRPSTNAALLYAGLPSGLALCNIVTHSIHLQHLSHRPLVAGNTIAASKAIYAHCTPSGQDMQIHNACFHTAYKVPLHVPQILLADRHKHNYCLLANGWETSVTQTNLLSPITYSIQTDHIVAQQQYQKHEILDQLHCSSTSKLVNPNYIFNLEEIQSDMSDEVQNDTILHSTEQHVCTWAVSQIKHLPFKAPKV